MAQLKADYELLIVFSTKDGDDVVDTLKADFKKRIEDNATITEEEDWGKRRLAYEIDYQTEGYYYLVRFNSKPDFPAELEERFSITDGILRFIIINDTVNKVKRDKSAKLAKKVAAEAKLLAEEAAEVAEKAKILAEEAAEAKLLAEAAAEAEKAIALAKEAEEAIALAKEAEEAEVLEEVVVIEEIIEVVEDENAKEVIEVEEIVEVVEEVIIEEEKE